MASAMDDRSLKRRQAAADLALRQQERDGFQRILYQGKCMAPILKDGCLVLVSQLPEHALSRGDLVAFRRDGQVFIHRFLSTFQGPGARPYLRTKADRYLTPDAPFPADLLLGKAMQVKIHGRLINLQAFPHRLLSRMIGLFSTLEALLHQAAKGIQPAWGSAGIGWKTSATAVLQFPKSLFEWALSRWMRS